MATVASVLASTLLYATLRYNVLKGVAWVEWPTYVLNKAAALSALLLGVLALWPRATPARAAERMRAAGWLGALHVGLSLALLGPATYPKYFADGKPTTAAAWSLLAGVLAAVLVRREGPASGARSRWHAGLVAFLPGVHAGLLGYGSWLEPTTWPGYLVPITLLAFATGCLGLALALLRPGAAR